MRYIVRFKVTDTFAAYAGTMEFKIDSLSKDMALVQAGRQYEVLGPPAFQRLELISVEEAPDEPSTVHDGARCQADIGGEG